jgi:hypothetical protein
VNRSDRRIRLSWLALLLLVPACQQKMAQQPYYRPYDETTFFKNGSSARVLEKGVVHRSQRLDNEILMSGLIPDERKKWANTSWKFDEKGLSEGPQPFNEMNKPLPNAPSDPKKFVDGFPFEIKQDDLIRGQERYQIYCIACHGPLGNGKGKVAERGYLKPTSYHTIALEENEVPESGDLPKGYSRGFNRFGIKIALRDVPVGYIYEVVTRGYGGMPSHAYMIPPKDRWRIVAYVRALQISQYTDPNDVKGLTDEAAAALKKKLEGIK